MSAVFNNKESNIEANLKIQYHINDESINEFYNLVEKLESLVCNRQIALNQLKMELDRAYTLT